MANWRAVRRRQREYKTGGVVGRGMTLTVTDLPIPKKVRFISKSTLQDAACRADDDHSSWLKTQIGLKVELRSLYTNMSNWHAGLADIQTTSSTIRVRGFLGVHEGNTRVGPCPKWLLQNAIDHHQFCRLFSRTSQLAYVSNVCLYETCPQSQCSAIVCSSCAWRR